jgi:hypothetical protein
MAFRILSVIQVRTTLGWRPLSIYTMLARLREIRAQTSGSTRRVEVYSFVLLTVEDVSGYCEGSNACPQQQTREVSTGKSVSTTKA